MAMPANKSSSPPITSRPNPNLRNSEVANPIRRSFTGNPFAKPSIIANPRSFNPNTPANSPSEHPRRSSTGRATVVTFRDCEDKENGKDQNWKQIKVRSPSGGTKGTKNFMSPTISAASKVTPSPRKKILAERNEPVRTSLVLDSPSSCNPTVEGSEHMEVGLTPPLVLKTPKTQTDLDLKELSSPKNEPTQTVRVHSSEEPDSVNLDPSFKISPRDSRPLSGPIIAPLDADPSAPPYDPKKNYLSPRPQFLHYRPNPRIECYLSKERDGKRLEDSFISGSFSDSEVTEDSQSENSQKELEEVTSDAVVEEEQKLEEENEEEEEVHVSEPSPISSTNIKPRFFSRAKFTALLLALALTLLSVSVINSPVIRSSVLKDLSFLKDDQSEVAEFARASFDRLAGNFRVWFISSVLFISELISNLRGGHNLGPLHYCNLTGLMEDVRVDGYSVFDNSDKGTEGLYALDVFEHTPGSVVNVEAFANKSPEMRPAEKIVDVHVDPEYEEQVDEDAEGPVSIEGVSEENSYFSYGEGLQAAQADVIEVENSKTEQSREENFGADLEPESNVSMEEEAVLISLADEIHIEDSRVEALKTANEMSIGAEVDSLKDHNPVSSESEFKVSWMNVLVVASSVSALIGSIVFMYTRKRKNSASSPRSAVQPLLTKKLEANPIVPVITEHTVQERPYSWNWIGEPCSSEMSSIEKSSSYLTKGLKPSDEAQSQEKRSRKNHRRESLASVDSSMDSPSYGSFTTYEKIPIKHGLGEEEIVTPVRRSSRIRKQVTSS